MNPDTKALRDMYRDAHIAITSYNGGIANGLISRQIDQVCDKKGIDFLLLASVVDRSEP